MDSKKIKFIAALFSVSILFGCNSTSDFSGNSNDSFSNEDYSQVEDSQILKINSDETKKTFGFADLSLDGQGISYPDTQNVIFIGNEGYKVSNGNFVQYTSSLSKRKVFTNAIASGLVNNSSVNSEKAIIILEGFLDLSDGKISDSDHSYFDEFDSDGKRKHQDIVYEIGSNKAILGTKNAKIAFGGLKIYAKEEGRENIIIQNITFWDAHGSTEIDTKIDSSSKASADNLVIEALKSSEKGMYSSVAKNIWVDHCSFTDGKCTDLIRNYNHDGAFDIKAVQNLTVSYCEFSNHDKVTLIAPNDDYKISEQRQITFHNNYYHDAVQRLPRSRGCQLHIYNNVYDKIGTSGNSGYSLGPGTGSLYIVENSYFGNFENPSNIVQYADKSSDFQSEYVSKFFQSGNNIQINNSNVKYDKAESLRDFEKYHLTDEKPWNIPYEYSKNMKSFSEAKQNVPNKAGANKEFKIVCVNGSTF